MKGPPAREGLSACEYISWVRQIFDTGFVVAGISRRRWIQRSEPRSRECEHGDVIVLTERYCFFGSLHCGWVGAEKNIQAFEAVELAGRIARLQQPISV